MKNILVVRFSSLGDLALTVPVFKTLEKNLPYHKFYLLTRPVFKPLFSECKNVKVITADIDHKYAGVFGLNKLAGLITNYHFDEVIDLHDVLLTKILRMLLKIKGSSTIVFNKGREEKNQVLKKKSTDKWLKHASDRYLEAFRHLMPGIKLTKGPYLDPSSSGFFDTLFRDADDKPFRIGLAFFSRHVCKEWGMDKSRSLLEKLYKLSNTMLVCFAFGERERSIAAEWMSEFPDLVLVDDKVPVAEQLSIMNELDVMLAMDSANMHLASLVDTPVVSIWGATHPALGFWPLNNEKGILVPSQKEAEWQPLSIYGRLRSEKSKALAKRSMDLIEVDKVYDKLVTYMP